MKKKKFLSLCFALLLAASSVAANAAGRGLVVPSASCVSKQAKRLQRLASIGR